MTNGLYGRCIHDLNPRECEWCKQNQKLRELIEKWKVELELILSIYPKEKLDGIARAATEDVHNKIQKLLEESKK